MTKSTLKHKDEINECAKMVIESDNKKEIANLLAHIFYLQHRDN